MENTNTLGPFDNDTPGDVPLPAAPLAKVLIQVRFPRPSAFVSREDDVARQIAGELAADFPVFDEGHEILLQISPEGVQQTQGSRIWLLRSADGANRVSFAHGFVALETTSYTHRSEFVGEFLKVWNAMNRVLSIAALERVGVRFVNRMTDPGVLADLPELLRPEIAGVRGIETKTAELVRSLSDALYQFEDGSVFQARWGQLPPNASIDPTVEPVGSTSWILDMDSSRAWLPGQYGGDDLEEITLGLALRSYQFFRWAVQPAFLTRFGGEV